MTCESCARLQAELDAVAPRWRTVHTIEAPIVVVSEANARDHHRVKAARVRSQRLTTLSALGVLSLNAPRPISGLLKVHLRLRVTLTRLGSKALDDDNLSGAFKAVRDAIAYFLSVDDGPKGPVTWAYAQETHKRHRLTPGIRIEIAVPDPRGEA